MGIYIKTASGLQEMYHLVEMLGATATENGSSGIVPTPRAGDQDKVLYGDGTWKPAASKIDEIKVNGTTQTITDKIVDLSVPTTLSSLTDDTTHRLVTDTEKASWNAKVDSSAIPTKTSDLTNDGDGTKAFLTEHQSLTDYAKTSDVVAKETGKSLINDTDIAQITTNKDAITTLNGSESTTGSVAQQIADAFNTKIVVSTISEIDNMFL